MSSLFPVCLQREEAFLRSLPLDSHVCTHLIVTNQGDEITMRDQDHWFSALAVHWHHFEET